MQTAILVLLILNLLITGGLIVLMLIRGQDRDVDTGGVTSRLDLVRQDLATQRGELRQTLALSEQQLASRITAGTEAQAGELVREREARTAANRELREMLDRGLERLNVTLKHSLEELRTGNEQKLEQMRLTVDEKLQGTLEKRLGESFSLVSERLEQVQKGLGEMQTLASDVGGLKRVLTNVKSRGGWGEVQLAKQLEDLMTGDQYEENVAVTPGSAERVEFALKLPGRRDDNRPVYLAIDSKFPQEDYERLLDAQDGGDAEDITKAHNKLERVLVEEAKRISSKYIDPPHTTDFAIMYLPTEGLFAETIRRPGLTAKLQQEQRVMVMGPTTLGAMLSSLQMGFRTLAIEKRSSEVWQVLGEAKAEFMKYGDVWDKLGKQLETAQNTVKQAGVRTRAVERRLRDVETLEVPSSGVFDDLIEEIADGEHV